jgi:hypothetical protein
VTATNHALTGAIVALAIEKPLLVVPLAVASHFLLDIIPHFGIHEDDVNKRNAHWMFRTVVSIDTVLVISLLIAVPLLANGSLSAWIILLGMVSALLPDSVWIYRFLRTMRTQIEHPYSKLSAFHQRIQWFERPWGLPIEIAWMVVAIIVINGLAP